MRYAGNWVSFIRQTHKKRYEWSCISIHSVSFYYLFLQELLLFQEIVDEEGNIVVDNLLGTFGRLQTLGLCILQHTPCFHLLQQDRAAVAYNEETDAFDSRLFRIVEGIVFVLDTFHIGMDQQYTLFFRCIDGQFVARQVCWQMVIGQIQTHLLQQELFGCLQLVEIDEQFAFGCLLELFVILPILLDNLFRNLRLATLDYLFEEGPVGMILRDHLQQPFR